MGLLSYTAMRTYANKMAGVLVQLRTGADAANTRATAIQTALLAAADTDQLHYLLDGARDAIAKCDDQQLMPNVLRALVTSLDAAAIATSSVTSAIGIDTYLKYYNIGAGGPWNCMLHPDTRLAFTLNGKTISPYNAYLEVLESGTYDGTTFTNALYKVVRAASVNTDTLGYVTDPLVYAGGIGYINCKTGFAGSSDTVTVVGNWCSSTDGTVSAGSGTATVAANGRVALTPPSTGAYLVNVTDITFGANITAGTFYAESQRPAYWAALPD
jgi:hypothetical protein